MREQLPRKQLGGATKLALILLRVYIAIAIPLVFLAFVRGLH